ncbi:hypothetical protein [Motilibacter aurantiacus]|uniref:hypothetical protein n=1 Tax=Motilibacter aurantiacus TaxID=2714955 RepID=UPI0014075B5C|nr:hypothetical protein [Motilibacter aurantiacus]NHC45699.1 hypothetical protein [Motilibacter aurantiacus]
MTTTPFEPMGNRDQEIAAADAGVGAPDVAPGFGIGNEEPDKESGQVPDEDVLPEGGAGSEPTD